MSRLFSVLLLALSFIACSAPHELTTTTSHSETASYSETASPQPIEFIVVQLNDVYEISPLDGGRFGGLARVATVIKQLKEKNPNTITVLSGDFVSPSLISSLSETVDGKRKRIAGAQIVAGFNAMGMDYVTFGNHEFDLKAPDLQSRIDESEFDYFSSNVLQKREGQSPRPFTQRGQDISTVATHVFNENTDTELRLGFVGLTLPFNQADYVHYEDVYEAGKSVYEEAKTNHDLVFAITHLAIEDDAKLARTIPDLPLIIGGHEHTDTLTTVGNTIISKADANARTVYIHWISYEPGSKDLDIWSQLMPITVDIKPDAETAAVVAAWEAKADALIGNMGYDANKIIATLPAPFDGREEMIRNYQTNLGRLVTCAMLDADESAEFAFINSGSIRVDDKVIGQVEERDILRTLPFGGAIVHGSLKGNVLKRVLDAGFIANKDAGGYFQISGNVAPSGDTYTINGSPINPETTYEVALPEFLSLGLEDNLDFMDEEATYRPIDDSGANVDIRNLVIQYLKNTDWLNDCSFAGIQEH